MNRVFATLALAGGLLTAGWFAPAALAAAGPAAGEMRVDDQAGAFTPEGVQKAKDAFQNTEFKSPAHLTVVTVGKVPEDRRAEFEAAAKSGDQRTKFFDAWARELARADAQKGVFALVYLEGLGDGKERYIVRTLASEKTDVHRAFTDADAQQVSKILTTGLDRAKGKPPAEARAARDAALLEATNFVAAELKDTSVPAARENQRGATGEAGQAGGSGIGLTGWICLGLCVLLGVWVVIGLIRGMSGGGGFGGGPGGGGFFTSLMGGMFGAMAGMWMYNSLFGGGMSEAGAADEASGDAGDTGDAGADNYDAGASGGSEGGDWGGGDAGGGDWGGGGDFGGGDW